MSRAATKTGTPRSRAIEVDQLRQVARRQFPDAPGHVVDKAVRTLHKMARAGRLRLAARPEA